MVPTRNTTYTANFNLQQSYDGATRSFNPERVAPGGSVTVTIQVGKAFNIIETLPDGFTYTGSSIDDPADDSDVLTVGQTVTFTPLGEPSFTYTVTASSTEGSHAFSGVARFDSDRDNDLPVGGASTVTVEAVIDDATLVARYDANGDGRIDRGEVIAAINDYLFGGAISRRDVIRLINLYLFAPSTPHNRPGAPEGLTAVVNGQTRMDLLWSAPPSDGGAAITGYRIEVSENGSSWIDLVVNTRNAATSYSHTGLTAGSTRHYRVSAINSAGTGPASNIATGTTAGDAATDRAALAALYNATDGANWPRQRNWLSNAPMGEWHGVTTDSDGRVTELDLSQNQLTGDIPAELGDLTNLEWLDLPINRLTGDIPAELGSLTNLEVLSLFDNRLTGEIPAELGDLTNLGELYLDNNRLSGEIPAELGNLTSLQGLYLQRNRLSGEIPAELGSLTNLEELYLDNNQLTGCIPEGLRDVPDNDLDELGLADCAAAASGQSKASFQNFHVIDVELDEYGDHDRECRTRLGSKYRLADWNDLKDYYTSGGPIPELIAGLNWKDENTPDVGVRHPRVARNGEVRFGSRRHYFVARHDHAPPGYFLVHDDLDDYHLSLGSWYGQGGEALCYKTG